MQNKGLSLIVLMMVAGLFVLPARAQDGLPTAEQPALVAPADKVAPEETAQERMDKAKQRREELEKMRAERMAAAKERAEKRTGTTPQPEAEAAPQLQAQPETPRIAPVMPDLGQIMPTPAVEQNPSQEQIQEENRRRLEEELKSTTISDKGVVDFPNRPSLGALELTPLPGINESGIAGPLPMGKSVSGKDLPSEQLLGRITPEVFQEMADLERGNTFLKLQKEKETLKNDLEAIKAKYRKDRLDEIEKRENVVRTRIQWWQEQEKLRLAIEKKQEEEEELARKIAMKEAERDQVQEEAKRRLRAQGRKTATSDQSGQVEEIEVAVDQVPERVEVVPQAMESLYAIESIRGIGTDLSARIRSKGDGMVYDVKRDDILPTGHVVQEVKKDTLIVAYGNRVDQLVFRPNQQ